jgi:sugar-specific transcriptional regulator TrmB
MADPDRSTALRKLGFTDLESAVYAALVTRAPMTAYAVGRTLGKPTANVYKAVEALARRGAVLVEDGENRVCRAVPPDLLLTRLEQAIQRDVEAARTVFAHAEPADADERVYRLDTAEEAITRCGEMLDRAERVAVVDAFPAALEAVRAALLRAVARRVRVFVEAYAPCTLPGAEVVVVEHGPLTIRRWRSEQLNVVIDGREHVAALLSQDLSRVYQAIWSDSLYLSCLMHAGRLAEHTLIRMTRLKRQRGVPPAMRRVLDEHPFFANSQVPGHAEIVGRFAGAAAAEPRQPAAGRRARKRQ